MNIWQLFYQYMKISNSTNGTHDNSMCDTVKGKQYLL